MNTVSFQNISAAFNALQHGDIDLFMSSQSRLLTYTHFYEQTGFKANITFDYPIESTFAYQNQRRASAPVQNIYQKIGIEPVINCVGTYTILGGSYERPAATQAKAEAGTYFAQLDEVAFGVGQRLADLTGAEWGVVSCGCAGGIKIVTAACLTGGNPERLIRIPDLTGFPKTEVVVPRPSRGPHDHYIRTMGANIVTVETPEEMQKALGPKTAMIYTTGSREPLSTETIARMAKPLNIPILVDTAASDLTWKPNIHLQAGATVVAYSGGKALCGPQCAGLLLGNKKILMSAWQASSPHHGPGRDNKVGKEEMMGMVAAVEDWINRDHDAKMRTWYTWLENISKRMTAINGVTCAIVEPTGLGNRSHRLTVSWNSEALNINGADVLEELAITKPRIAVRANAVDNNGITGVSITSGQMQSGEDKIVADRLYEILSRKYEKPKGMAAPLVNISGRWDVDIEFFNSKGRHSFYIEQDGNYVGGSHKGEFTNREMYGVVDGNKIKLLSTEANVNYHPWLLQFSPFTFYGTATNDRMEGEIYLYEYLRAKFTAARYKQDSSISRPIIVPQGQPLAT